MRCADEGSSRLLRECYSEFVQAAMSSGSTVLRYDISPTSDDPSWTVQCNDREMHCRNSYELIYEFEKDMTQRVQLLRTDLFFIHGAALASGERCVVISGASGSGKSSLAWCMSHSGFDYLSDELAPIDPCKLQIEPYPHALCLKNAPLSGPALPDSTLYTAATIHVPARELRTRPLDQPCPLSFLVFIDETVTGRDLVTRSISRAESAARLYANGLNQLSHPGEGLPVVASMARGMPAHRMSGGTVTERARAIQKLFDAE